MTIIFPEGVPTLAADKVNWVSALALPNEPALSEITAAYPASLEISCALYAGSFQPTQTVNRTAAPRRACQRTALERTTSVTRSLPDITYAIDPQAAAGSDGKIAFETLAEGLSGFIVARFGLDVETVDWETGQWVNVYPVRLGPALIINPADDGAEYQVTQAVDISGTVIQNVQIDGSGS